MIRVLSVQTRLLGNLTYGMLLRALFADSNTIDFRAVWSNETQTFVPRAINRVLISGGRIGSIRHNVDFWGTRYEYGASMVADRVLRTALEEGPADVLHLHTQGIAWRSLDVMRRIPTVISADMTAMQAAQQETAPEWAWTHQPRVFFERRVFRAAAAVVAFSRWAADSISNGHEIDRSRVHVIHPGIRNSELAAFAELRAARASSTERETRLLFVGGEFERKGGPLLLDVFLKRFASSGAVLDLVTQDAVTVEHPNVRVHRDVVPFSDRWRDLYARASMLVVPTQRDASAHVSIEAMAAGLPIVTTAVGGIPEIVIDGETGYLIAPADGTRLAERIGTLLEDADLRSRMGDAGRQRVERFFDASVNGARLARVFEDVAGERRREVA